MSEVRFDGIEQPYDRTTVSAITDTEIDALIFGRTGRTPEEVRLVLLARHHGDAEVAEAEYQTLVGDLEELRRGPEASEIGNIKDIVDREE